MARPQLIFAALLLAAGCFAAAPSSVWAWNQVDLESRGGSAPRVTDAPAWYLLALRWPAAGISDAPQWVNVDVAETVVPASSFDSSFGRVSVFGLNEAPLRRAGVKALAGADYYAQVVFAIGKTGVADQPDPFDQFNTGWCWSSYHGMPGATKVPLSTRIPHIPEWEDAFSPSGQGPLLGGRLNTHGPYHFEGDGTTTRDPSPEELRVNFEQYRVSGVSVAAWRPGVSVPQVVFYGTGTMGNLYGSVSASGEYAGDATAPTASDFRPAFLVGTQQAGVRTDAGGLFTRASGTSRRDMSYVYVADGIVWETTDPDEVAAVFAAVAAGEYPGHPGVGYDEEQPPPGGEHEPWDPAEYSLPTTETAGFEDMPLGLAAQAAWIGEKMEWLTGALDFLLWPLRTLTEVFE